MKKHLYIKRSGDKVEIWISDEFYKFFYDKRYYIQDNVIKSYSSIISLSIKLNLKEYDVHRVLVGNPYNSTDLYNGNLTLSRPSNKINWFKSAEYNLKFPTCKMKEYSECFYKNTSIILIKMFEHFKKVRNTKISTDLYF
jgi:hypothetical protein